jgi:hypothetical protein
MAERCENCGRGIGNLEAAYVYQGSIVCRECNERLDPLAAAAAAVASSKATRPDIQMIEQTAKHWKAQMLTGGIIMIVAFIVGMIAGQMRDGEPIVIGSVAVFLVGFIWYAFARARAWWNHG